MQTAVGQFATLCGGCSVTNVTKQPPLNVPLDAESNSDVESNSEPTAKAAKFDSSDSEISYDLPSASGAVTPDFNITGGLKGIDYNSLEFEGLMQFVDVEHPELKAMWDTVVTVTDEEMARIRATADTNIRRKLVTLNCIKSMCRLLLSNATLCGGCFVTNKQFHA